MSSIRDLYLPYVERKICSVFNESIEEIIFWCPSLRTGRNGATTTAAHERQGHTTTPRSGYVATAHIDTDVNAYESMEALVEIIVKNKVDGMRSSSAGHIVDLITKQGRRFGIVNAWRNIKEQPVTSAPLAFMPARYKNSNTTGFPQGEFDENSSVWYTFPNMTRHELLLFSQYDRDASYASDLWHCALVDRLDKQNPRASFDIRCFLLFRETTPSSRDRIGTRLPSGLDREGSTEFCAEQSRKRQE